MLANIKLTTEDNDNDNLIQEYMDLCGYTRLEAERAAGTAIHGEY